VERKTDKLDKEMQKRVMRSVTYPVKVRVEKTGIRITDETIKIVNERLKSGEEITIATVQQLS
jgi:hydroxymethylpyrimidine/phosphomethylpyrimidine kinase